MDVGESEVFYTRQDLFPGRERSSTTVFGAYVEAERLSYTDHPQMAANRGHTDLAQYLADHGAERHWSPASNVLSYRRLNSANADDRSIRKSHTVKFFLLDWIAGRRFMEGKIISCRYKVMPDYS